MVKYKLVGVTKYAERYLDVDDLESIKDMIGCEITLNDKFSIVDDKRMFNMPDGKITHSDYLQVEEILPIMDFTKKV